MRTINKNFHLSTLLLLLATTGAVSVFILSPYLFGNYLFTFLDVGSDTAQQYLSLYASIARNLSGGHFSLWDSTNGFGNNIFIMNLTNPALLVVYLIGAVFGAEVIPFCMGWVYLAELLASGAAIYLFLTEFSFSEPVKLLTGVMYTFSGFMLVWGQHYQFGIVPVLVPLELLMAERFLRNRRRWIGLVLMTFLLVMNSMYVAYMTLLMSGSYVIGRSILRHSRLREGVREVLQSAGAMILGVCLAGCSLIPSAMAISTVSDRLEQKTSLFHRLFLERFPREYFVTLAGRTFSTTARGINRFDGYLNYYEAPCLFFSTLFIFLALQYVFLIPGMRSGKKQKILHYAAGVVAAAGVALPTLPVIMNGFTGVFSRFFFLYMVYFALVSAFTLREMIEYGRISRIGLALGFLAVLYFYTRYLRAYLPNPKGTSLALLATGLIMGAALASLGRKGRSRSTKWAIGVLLLALLVNVAADGRSNFVPLRNQKIEFLEDAGNFRLAETKTGEFMDTMTDSDTKAALQLIRKEESEFIRIEKLYGATVCMDSAFQGYAGVSTYNSIPNKDLKEFVRTYWPGLSYQDLMHWSFWFSGWKDDSRQAEAAGIRYLLTRDQKRLPGYEPWKTVGSVQILKNDSVQSIGSFYDQGAYRDLGQDPEGTHLAQVSYDQRDRDAVLSIPDPDHADRMTASVTAPKDGLFYLALPFEQGWSIRVDGKKVDPVRVNAGMTGVPLKKGSHKLTLRYVSPGLKAGIGLSLMALAVFIIALVRSGKRKQRA